MTDSDDEWEAPEHFWIGNPERKGSGNGAKPESSHVEDDADGLRPDHEQIAVENSQFLDWLDETVGHKATETDGQKTGLNGTPRGVAIENPALDDVDEAATWLP